MNPIENAVAKAARASNADHVVLVLADGETVRIAIAKGKRNKWQALQQAVEGYDWMRAECCDAKGGVLQVVRNEDDRPTTPAAAMRVPRVEGNDAIAMLSHFAALLAESQDRTAIIMAAAQKDAMAAMDRSVNTMGNLVGSLHSIFTDYLATQRRILEMRDTGAVVKATGDDPDDPLAQLIKLAQLKSMFPNAATPPPATKNGAPKGAAPTPPK